MFALGLSHERNTAFIASNNCSFGSVGKSLPIFALYSALNHYKNLSDEKLLIVSDSRYVINIFALQWVDSWVKNGWKRGKYPVKNQQIIKPLYELVKSFKDLSFMWVKGHSYTLGNNRVDLLVNQAMDEYQEKKGINL